MWASYVPKWLSSPELCSQPANRRTKRQYSQPTARMLFPGFPGNRAEALSLNSRLIRPIRADQPGIDATVGSSTPRSPNQISGGRVWKNAPSKAQKKIIKKQQNTYSKTHIPKQQNTYCKTHASL